MEVRNKQISWFWLLLFASHKLISYNHLLKLRWNEWTHARQGPNLCARRGDLLELLSHLQIVEASLHLCRINLLKQYFHVVDVSTFESFFFFLNQPFRLAWKFMASPSWGEMMVKWKILVSHSHASKDQQKHEHIKLRCRKTHGSFQFWDGKPWKR